MVGNARKGENFINGILFTSKPSVLLDFTLRIQDFVYSLRCSNKYNNPKVMFLFINVDCLERPYSNQLSRPAQLFVNYTSS